MVPSQRLAGGPSLNIRLATASRPPLPDGRSTHASAGRQAAVFVLSQPQTSEDLAAYSPRWGRMAVVECRQHRLWRGRDRREARPRPSMLCEWRAPPPAELPAAANPLSLGALAPCGGTIEPAQRRPQSASRAVQRSRVVCTALERSMAQRHSGCDRLGRTKRFAGPPCRSAAPAAALGYGLKASSIGDPPERAQKMSRAWDARLERQSVQVATGNQKLPGPGGKRKGQLDPKTSARSTERGQEVSSADPAMSSLRMFRRHREFLLLGAIPETYVRGRGGPGVPQRLSCRRDMPPGAKSAQIRSWRPHSATIRVSSVHIRAICRKWPVLQNARRVRDVCLELGSSRTISTARPRGMTQPTPWQLPCFCGSASRESSSRACLSVGRGCPHFGTICRLGPRQRGDPTSGVAA